MSDRGNTPSIPAGIVDWVERLHAVVDELAAPIAAGHGERLRCRAGCSGCCSDDLRVFTIEAAVIMRHHAQLLETGEPHPEGACAFLDGDGACRIYEHRPYVCRTQGLPLRWIEEDEEDGAAVEVRDVCPLNLDGGPALEELPADACWAIGPIEERLASRQAELAVASDLASLENARVPLRALFARSTDGSGEPLFTDGSGEPLFTDGSGEPLFTDGSGEPREPQNQNEKRRLPLVR